MSWKTFACFKLGSLEKQILPRDLHKRSLLGSILYLGGSGELRKAELWRGKNWSPVRSQEAPANPWGPRWTFSVVLPWNHGFSVLCPPDQAVSWEEAWPWRNSLAISLQLPNRSGGGWALRSLREVWALQRSWHCSVLTWSGPQCCVSSGSPKGGVNRVKACGHTIRLPLRLLPADCIAQVRLYLLSKGFSSHGKWYSFLNAEQVADVLR